MPSKMLSMWSLQKHSEVQKPVINKCKHKIQKTLQKTETFQKSIKSVISNSTKKKEDISFQSLVSFTKPVTTPCKTNETCI